MPLPVDLIAISCVGTAYVMNFVARFKAMNPNNHPAEDKALGVDDKQKEEFTKRLEEQGGVDRWTRIAENQGENFPMHFFVLWAALVVGGNKEHVAYCFAAYLGFRVLFAICYMLALSPWRSITFLLGQLSIVVAIPVGVLGVRAQAEDAEPPTTLFRFAGLIVTALLFKMNFVALLKSSDPNNHPKEDSALGITDKEKGEYKTLIEGQGGVNRWGRIASNQLESFPCEVAVFWGAYGVGADPKHLAMAFAAYAGLRVLFVCLYLCQCSPWRSVSWGLSKLTVIAGAALGITAATRAPPELCGVMLSMACTCVLWFVNVFACVKAMDPNNHPAEDSALGVDDKQKEEFAKRLEAQGGVDRWTRVAINQCENFPIANVVFWGAAIVGTNIEKVGYCFVAYVSFRLLFVFCYLYSLAPWRTLAFLGSQISVITMVVFGVMAAQDAEAVGGLPLSCLAGAGGD